MEELELIEWAENHYEISVAVSEASDSECSKIYGLSKGELWEVSKSLTDTFTNMHKDVLWGDVLEYFPTLEDFLTSKLY